MGITNMDVVTFPEHLEMFKLKENATVLHSRSDIKVLSIRNPIRT